MLLAARQLAGWLGGGEGEAEAEREGDCLGESECLPQRDEAATWAESWRAASQSRRPKAEDPKQKGRQSNDRSACVSAASAVRQCLARTNNARGTELAPDERSNEHFSWAHVLAWPSLWPTRSADRECNRERNGEPCLRALRGSLAEDEQLGGRAFHRRKPRREDVRLLGVSGACVWQIVWQLVWQLVWNWSHSWAQIRPADPIRIRAGSVSFNGCYCCCLRLIRVAAVRLPVWLARRVGN